MDIPHLSLPFRFENGRAATVPQDSEDEIAQSIMILVTTPKGSRPEVPEFGVPPVLFKQSSTPVTNDILAAVSRWDPRAQVDVSSQIDDVDDLVRDLSIRVRPAIV